MQEVIKQRLQSAEEFAAILQADYTQKTPGNYNFMHRLGLMLCVRDGEDYEMMKVLTNYKESEIEEEIPSTPPDTVLFPNHPLTNQDENTCKGQCLQADPFLDPMKHLTEEDIRLLANDVHKDCREQYIQICTAKNWALPPPGLHRRRPRPRLCGG